MRQLRACDFCGGDAAGTFEVIPPELEPSENEQRRVILCDPCRGQFADLIEPLLARAGVAPAESAGSASSAPDGSTTSHDTADGQTDRLDWTGGDSEGTALASGSRDERSNRSVGIGADGSHARGVDTQNRSPQTGRDRERANGGITAADASDSGGPDEDAIDGITFTGDHDGDGLGADGGPNDARGIVPEESPGKNRESDTTASLAAGAADEGGVATPDESVATPAESSNTADGQTEPGDGSTGSPDESAETQEEPPRGYRNLLRLLRNRQLPMKRSAVEDLAASAYDLEDHEVEAAIDYAVEQGTLDQDGKRLDLA